jgi:hypothetical protein
MFSKRQKLDMLFQQLKNERTSWENFWREVATYICPYRPKFFTTDNNRGYRLNQNIIDSTAEQASLNLAATMMAYTTPPSKEWFRLSTPYRELNELKPVKVWLREVERDMNEILNKSNFYKMMPLIYLDALNFGTACLYVERDSKNFLNFKAQPVGSFYLSTNSNGVTNVYAREFELTVRQLVTEFGMDENGKINWDRLSNSVKTMWENSRFDGRVEVRHVVEPNPDYKPDSRLAKHKRYRSTYYEYLRQGSDDLFLRESGYDFFPALTPRWQVTGEDVYGTNCPGMIGLGSAKEIQLLQKKLRKATDKVVDPPLVAPPSARNSKLSLMSGDVNFSGEPDNPIRPLHQISYGINETMALVQDLRSELKNIFYENIFLSISSSDQRERTAAEIHAREGEKLAILGPTYERFNVDLILPLIDMMFEIMIEEGVIRIPPSELDGVDLKIEGVSTMAQAQKLIGVGSLERFVSMAGMAMQANPESSIKIDFDQYIDVAADMLNVDPTIIRSDEEVSQMREQQAQMAQQQQMMQAAQAVAGTAKDLSSVDMSGDNALTRMVGQSG